MNGEAIKICFVIDTLKIGGTEKQLIEVIRNLDSKRFKSYLICLRNSEMLGDLDIDCTKFVLDIKSIKSINTIKKIKTLRSFLMKEKIDIVQTFFIDANILGVIAARLAGVKKTISCRRDMGFWYDKKKLNYLWFINKFVDRFLVNSEAIKQNLSNIENVSKEKIDIIYNGIDLKLFDSIQKKTKAEIKSELNVPHHHMVVGCIANFNRDVKRVDVFIKASAIVSQSIENVSFLIIGDGCLRNELVELAKTLNVNNEIIFAGQRNDIASLLQIIDIGVLTSDSEGFSNSIIEYMAAGIPTVATDVGGNRELIENNIDGFLTPSDNPQLVADAILKLINDEKLRVTMGNTSKQKIHQRFSLEKMIKNLENYYSSILNY